jgi:beta propeller repeat protein
MNLLSSICRTVCTLARIRQLAVACLEAMILAATAFSAPWKPIPVYPSADDQEAPDIYCDPVYGNRVVWQQLVTSQGATDWDIYSADITDPKQPVLTIVSEYTQDQMNPAIFETTVAWQDNYYGDWDIYIRDISSSANPDILLTDQLKDQTNPAIWGNFVVWQDNTADDWNIWLGDITDTANVQTYSVAVYDYDQQNPAIDREWVTWEDNFVWDNNPDGIWDLYGADVLRPNKPAEYLFGGFVDPQQRSAISGRYVVWQQQYNGTDDWDIYAEDISDPANPKLIVVAIDSSNAINPDISGNLIVWQDDRNTDWDIYGYNLATRREFLISDAQPNQTVFSNQTNPAISGTTVVWEDDLGGKMTIYMALMSGSDEVATCDYPPLGDTNGDCVVNLTDLADFSQYWLYCGLEPISACL